MIDQHTDDVGAGSSECEFVPPLELPDTWGVAWERQLRVMQAWQGADANNDGEGSVIRSPTMRTLIRLNTLLASLREQLLQIQSEAANVAVAEMSQRQVPTPAVALGGEALRPLHAGNIERLTELTRAWFELVVAAQSEMAALTGLAPAGTRPAAATGAPTFVDRRRRAEVIDFRDRRAA